MIALVLTVLCALAAAVVALLVARWLRRWRGSWRARVRAARAGRGEDAAADLLEAAGYRVLGRQVRVEWAPVVDGERCPLELRADYLVEKAGEQLIAEVKTGEEAPSIQAAATRRQLLEYRVAFAVDGVLLVCPERGAIHRIEFELELDRD
ncbi:MAG: hypothetical protein ACM31C_08255 [Acidobacteriota bacterium]